MAEATYTNKFVGGRMEWTLPADIDAGSVSGFVDSIALPVLQPIVTPRARYQLANAREITGVNDLIMTVSHRTYIPQLEGMVEREGTAGFYEANLLTNTGASYVQNDIVIPVRGIITRSEIIAHNPNERDSAARHEVEIYVRAYRILHRNGRTGDWTVLRRVDIETDIYQTGGTVADNDRTDVDADVSGRTTNIFPIITPVPTAPSAEADANTG